MRDREHRPAYPCDLSGTAWLIVIPVAGKLAPLVPEQRFPSRGAAERWLRSDAGRRFVATAQAERRLPAEETA